MVNVERDELLQPKTDDRQCLSRFGWERVEIEKKNTNSTIWDNEGEIATALGDAIDRLANSGDYGRTIGTKGMAAGGFADANQRQRSLVQRNAGYRSEKIRRVLRSRSDDPFGTDLAGHSRPGT